MKYSLALPSIAAWLVSSASAHSIFQELYVNGVDQGHMAGIRVPDYDGPIMDVTSNDIICNGGINPYHQPVSQKVITVPAGAQVTAEWHHTLSGADPSDPADPIDASHHGPILAYLAKVPDALQTDVTGLQWFKIYEDGYTSGTWAVDKLIRNKGKVDFSIPSCIPAGQYLLRVELIALHAAGSYPGAQFYMECAQLEITGGGSASPATVSFPGAYHGSDPGITINIYTNLPKYTIPGPPVFSCNGGGGGGGSTTGVPPTSTTTTHSPPPSSTTTTSTPPPSTTTTPPSTGTIAQYGQCGGIGWVGETACVAPYTCHKINDYYSQCL